MSTSMHRLPDAHPARPIDPSLRQLLEVAQRAAAAASAELLEHFGSIRATRTKSTPTDLVSDADIAAERAIRDVLIADRPDDGHIGEEGSRRPSSSGIHWVFDPLDGSVNYILGDREWSVSIAAVDENGPVVGVVLEPLTARLRWAVRGHGAWEGEEPLSVRDTADLSQAMVLAGLDYHADRRIAQMETFTELIGNVRDIRRHGSAALELCRIADGTADAYVECPIWSWDIEAGALIAREAGAHVVIERLAGEQRSIFASAPAIAQPLAALLTSTPHGAIDFDFLIADKSVAPPLEGDPA